MCRHIADSFWSNLEEMAKRAILCWYELTTVLPLVCGFMFGKDGEILKELKRAVVVDGR